MRKKLLILLLVIFSFYIGVVYATTFSYTYDTATPAGGDDPAEADDRMREIKAAVQERMNVDHYWPLTGTEVSDTDAGEHRKVTLRTGSAPSAVANKGFVYAKDVSGKAELFYIDEDGNEVQLTSGGKILSASLDMKDEDDMASDSATHVATQQSIKAYVDAVDSTKEDKLASQATAGIFGDWTTKDTSNNALAENSVYKAACDGCISFSASAVGSGTFIYTDENNPPTTKAAGSDAIDSPEAGNAIIKKGEYVKVATTSGTFSGSIRWLPIGTGALVKQ